MAKTNRKHQICTKSGFLQKRPKSTSVRRAFCLIVRCWDNTDKVPGDGEREREGEREVTAGVFGDSWETAHSSFSQNMKWEQHNILETDKIPFHPLSSLSLFGVTIDTSTLSDHHSRSKGSHEAHTHTHTSFLWEFMFSNQPSGIIYCTLLPALFSGFYNVIKTSLPVTEVRKTTWATGTKRWKTGWKTWRRGRTSCDMKNKIKAEDGKL